MMNGLRQFMAVTIIFMATPLLVKKKYVSMILVVLLASTIHTSALIMLPVIFIVQGEIWNWKTISFSILSIIAMYVFSINIEVMDLLLVGTEYAGTAATWGALGDDGVNPIRVLVNAIPMLLSFVGRDIIKKDNNPIINICVNMSIITTGIYLIGMVTSGIMIGRLPIYTSLYNLILLPYLAKKVFAKDSIRLVNVLMVLLYFIYYFFET